MCKSVFKENNSLKPLYFLPRDDLTSGVLVPAFKEAHQVDCMMGFFSSNALRVLAPGLATFLRQTSGIFRLIISPILSVEDRNAIEKAIKTNDCVIEEIFISYLTTEDGIKRHTLECLAHLISTGRLELKIAIMKDALFHPKVWLFHYDSKTIAVHGSSNLTGMGLEKNFEQISVSQSWQDPNQNSIVFFLYDQFQRLWDGIDDDCTVIPAPQAIKNRLIKTYLSENLPKEQDLFELMKTECDIDSVKETISVYKKPIFKIPEWLNYKEGAFSHQGKAVDAWLENDYKGILEMATGAGKTITAMICAYRLFEKVSPLLIVVAAPYLPLVEQWCEEIRIFGLSPNNLTRTSGRAGRSRELQRIRRRMKSGLSMSEVVVVSHDTLCDDSFHQELRKFACKKLIIADEAHNLGRHEFIQKTPDFFEYRLALSATPERQYDRDGTEALYDFFGKSVFQFTLREAIGTCLVQYDYFVHPVYLTQEEMDEWYEITAKIKSNTWRIGTKGPDEYLAKLFRDRRKLLETSRNKIRTLELLLEKEDLKNIRHTLIYATDKDPAQLEEINKLLKKKRVLFHQLTAEETRRREKAQRIIKDFQNGDLQILTAKRVLDEGVNIPQINKAFILASTTVERQWIQRRGRLLRTCKETNKDHSVIHDFIALPAGYYEMELDDDAKKLIKSELKRVQEFASAARNAGRNDGPLPIIDKMVDALYG